MKRSDLEHLIRAAAVIADDDDIVVIGSQAILGQFPDTPEELLVSNEADMYPRNHPERADLVDGAIGEPSTFHDTFGYYTQGVSATTAVLPDGWEGRLIRVCNANTRNATGWCLEVHDLLISKCVAGRPKDAAFVVAVLRHGLASPETLEERLRSTSIRDRDVVSARLKRWTVESTARA